MMKHDVLQLWVLFISVFFGAYLIVFNLLVPFSWYVNITKLEPQTVCVGDDVVLYETDRTPRWGIKGTGYSQIVQFTSEFQLETTIIRGTVDNPTSFGYEPNTTSASYETRWFESDGERYVWSKVGTYGANDWITIHPLPFVSVDRFNKASEAKFNVINCN